MLPLHLRIFLVALAWSLSASTMAFGLQNSAPAQAASGSFQAIVDSANRDREAGKTDQAISEFSRALALRPDWAEGWWDLGMTQYEANQYESAVSSFRNLTRLAPAAGIGWSMLGLSQFETKDYAGALASLKKAQKLGGIPDPEIARVSAYHLALLLIHNAQFEQATVLLKSAVGESTSPQVKTALGLALLRAPLLPSEVDPSKDALIQAAGQAAAAAEPGPLAALVQQYPSVPWLHYAYGLALASAGQIAEGLAQEKLEAAVSSDSPLPWIEISKLELRLNHPAEALSAARRALSLDTQSSAAHDALAEALKAKGKAEDAAFELRKAERLSSTPPRRDPRMVALYGLHPAGAAQPDDSKTWNSAMLNFSAGRYADAIPILKSWVERNPGDGTAWAMMGLSEYAQKDYGNARIHLQRGVNLGIKASPQAKQLASYRLALLLIREDQFDAATSLLRTVAGQAPVSAQIQLALGLALLRIPTLPEDLSVSQRELAQSAGAIVPLLFASRYSEAFPMFETLIAEHPATPWLHYAYGDALDSLSRYDDAKAQMRIEAKLSPHSALPWIRLASINMREHMSADALHAAQTAVAISPESAEAHYELGRAWLESGDAQKSIDELERANRLKPNTAEIHFALARAYTKANLPEKAAAERAAFMQLKAMANRNAGEGESILQTDRR